MCDAATCACARQVFTAKSEGGKGEKLSQAGDLLKARVRRGHLSAGGRAAACRRSRAKHRCMYGGKMCRRGAAERCRGARAQRYGSAYLVTSITFAVISYALCYFLVDSGVDVAALLAKARAHAHACAFLWASGHAAAPRWCATACPAFFPPPRDAAPWHHQNRRWACR